MPHYYFVVCQPFKAEPNPEKGVCEMEDESSAIIQCRADADTISFYTHDDRAGQRNCNYLAVAFVSSFVSAFYMCIYIFNKGISITMHPFL